jgi:hypothetical protein
MTKTQLGHLSKDIDALHAKHTAHPAILLVQSKDGRQIFSLLVGNPSREWLCHVLGDELKRCVTDSFFLHPKVN